MAGERENQDQLSRRSVVIIGVLLALLAVMAVVVPFSAVESRRAGQTAERTPLAANLDLNSGTALNRPAPAFALRDQFGKRVSLRDYRGRVMLLAFAGSECSTVCPLRTMAMVDAKRDLGAAGRRVALVEVNADPSATSRAEVRAYSRAPGMLHQWQFLTGSLTQLEHLWHAYGADVEILAGDIERTPLYVIDAQGRLQRRYMTQMSYASVPQLGQLVAQEVSSLLGGSPRVSTSLSYAQVSSISPTAATSLPRAGGGTVSLGPGRARLLLFFATWNAGNLSDRLDALDAYQQAADAQGLPALAAIDEGSVEPSETALPGLLHPLPKPLSYPVAIDQTGRPADGYGVQDLPWFVLVSASGKIVWAWDVATQGWPSAGSLASYVRAALSRPPSAKTATAAALAGSPAPLTALHAQASQLLGSAPALMARIRSLRGYPIVINVWASWSEPCLTEFPLLASASERYGREVAFLGADINDAAASARAFLAGHPVSYPSYQATGSQLSALAPVANIPSTIFINPAGKVVHTQVGQYNIQGTLDRNIRTYALNG